ncbi:TRAP transporter small permease [Egibacter rhizosphaerae]|uniref:TRAP transporter small permease n=1 Tax=Egibacter rhizosphaerae TaxID=1670831 RepID=A0A411YIV1_9ACTN|nr:TRAP transporter small permease [Egibacter rhizosphaerae]QBI21006.1 TRAP transporter small permease [Egibacter rhizosphaerae]
MDRFVRGSDLINRGLHYIAASILLVLMLMIATNIVGRWGLGFGVPGTVELTQLAMTGLVFFGMAYAENRGDHVTIDLAYLKMPRPVQRATDVFASLLTIVVLALVAWQLNVYRQGLVDTGRETNTLGIPLHPVAWLAVLGIVAYGLAVISTWIERSRRGATDDESGGPDDGEADSGGGV